MVVDEHLTEDVVRRIEVACARRGREKGSAVVHGQTIPAARTATTLVGRVSGLNCSTCQQQHR
jgi:hypothetical protein